MGLRQKIEDLRKEVEDLRKEVEDLRRIVGTDHGRGQGLYGGQIRSQFRDDLNRELIYDRIDQVRREADRDIKRLVALIPDVIVVTQFKSSERPPEQLFKAVNKFTGAFAYGATEDGARGKVTG
jgi:hypothetical protein